MFNKFGLDTTKKQTINDIKKFPPYDKNFYEKIKENFSLDEAAAIRIIFEQYVNTDIGANGLAKYLENHGIRKIVRQNGKNLLFDTALIRRIIKNPVYCGKESQWQGKEFQR